MSLPWEWLTPILLLAVFGGFAARDARMDRSPRRPQLEWWWNRRPQDWWAKRPHASLRRRTTVSMRGDSK